MKSWRQTARPLRQNQNPSQSQKLPVLVCHKGHAGPAPSSAKVSRPGSVHSSNSGGTALPLWNELAPESFAAEKRKIDRQVKLSRRL
jgi:hypothetical protein